ncbi:S-DNA-T family DNA segregation ATPase FtsK/SpoIIIE [Paenibacillus sp. V4I3]|uniref:DNA translocase FtsK n=1 Tax=unclassified Paenibacillus TaxID=185978 RepID=UPI0027810677|nr:MULTISPECIES: DNA translocase FtsK [unclassified Paenibacillus]MDQ0876379.1 S-DNA-T family DNA segregation ATPase FtsK/SpoIIIE [Paenibacillus sp. V4I3]MDQ0887588.1 S-DNA-T family DNA segregation ATPase FtsK/SpoIIIE [Paenibacillus sp. V4I9]
MAKRKKKGKALKTSLLFELYGILILIFSVIALAHQGHVGNSLIYLFRFFVGTWYSLIPLIFIYVALYAMIKRAWPQMVTPKKAGILLFILGLLIKNHIDLFAQLYPDGGFTSGKVIGSTWNAMLDGLHPTEAGKAALEHGIGGGMIGAMLYSVLYFLFDYLGARLIQYALFVMGFILATGISYVDIGNIVKGRFSNVGQNFKDRMKEWLQDRETRQPQTVSAGASAPKAKKSSYVPVDDEFDEEVFQPVKRAKKTPLFMELLRPNKENRKKAEVENNSNADDLNDLGAADETEQVLYKSSAKQAAESDSPSTDQPITPIIRDFQEQVFQEAQQAVKHPAASSTAPVSKVQGAGAVDTDEEPVTLEFEENVPIVQTRPYEMPSLELLAKPAVGKGSEMADYKANARKLEATLESFGVRAKVLEVVRGPAVTRYEIQPDVGVKVSRIVSLTDDIALALAAKDIRMEAPIPGKAAIGIEVPNLEVSIVTMREVMETSAFQESSSRLSVVLGRDISGQPIVGNLARMPHLLVAGATGSGKSVCINGIITSILYKAKPNEVKFLMIDPKMVELNVYNGIPHLLAPVVTDPRRASLALKKVVVEMEKRYELFSKSGTRNIEGYNAMLTESGTAVPLPYYVVIVDELADLMMVAANDVEDSITRLAQMARAAGIHLIIATQRPSVDVITGVIKANIPSRIAFGVSSQVDSRTILDMVGAEKLLGRGDMLYLPVGASKPVRIQGAFLSDQEVEHVVGFVRTQEQANYQEEMVPHVEEMPEQQNEFEDELYDQAVQIVLEAKQASVSLLQRRMRVGYTRAARLVDSMEAKGVVGPYEGSKPREVLMSIEQYHHNRISS